MTKIYDVEMFEPHAGWERLSGGHATKKKARKALKDLRTRNESARFRIIKIIECDD